MEIVTYSLAICSEKAMLDRTRKESLRFVTKFFDQLARISILHTKYQACHERWSSRGIHLIRFGYLLAPLAIGVGILNGCKLFIQKVLCCGSYLAICQGARPYANTPLWSCCRMHTVAPLKAEKQGHSSPNTCSSSLY